MEKTNYMYIVRCCDGSLYTGWTNDLKHRIDQHNAGRGAKYTRSRRPVELVYFEVFDDKILAMKREAQVKKFRKSRKEKLVGSMERSKLQD